MEQYTVTGMSCAACSARVEQAVLKVEGVTSCSVNLLTNSMVTEGTASEEAIISAVEQAGYGAFKKGTEQKKRTTDSEEKTIRLRLVASVLFLLPLMYFSMGHTMWGWYLPKQIANNHVAIGLLQLLLSTIIIGINQKFFISGLKGLLHKAPNMDTLVALGSGASFLYSTACLFAMTDAQMKGDLSAVMHYMHEFYFESAAMILVLITLGKMLEARSKGKTTDALKSLMELAPSKATIIMDGKEVSVPVEQVKKGSVFLVRPGENIPVDGVVLEGMSAVNESALTGESVPIDKAAGDAVSAATINQSGFLKCEATKVGEDTTLSQIIRMVSDAAATKAPIAKAADRVSGVFVPVVMVIAFIATIAWLIAGESIGFALARGISVLVISCPCALGLATPVAIMVGSGVGAKNGILFKTALSLEETGKTKIIALDKTGTITQGKPQVTDIIPAPFVTEQQLFETALALEQKSEHPLAKAIVQKGDGMTPLEVTEFQVFPGNGLTAKIGQETVAGGNRFFISTHAEIPPDLLQKAEQLADMGKTPLFFAKNHTLLGLIAVADVIKEDSPQAIKELQNMGIRVVMLTGDNQKTAETIGKQAGVNEVIAGVLPDGKENVIRNLKDKGKTAMVGDGINDAPALTRADIGIAIGAGTDIAIDSADVVLMKSKLSDVVGAIRLSRAVLKNIHQNLFWAFFYNVIGIPLAAGVWIPLFGWKLNPMFGAAAMSLSSVFVVTNALRLNFISIRDTKKEKKRNPRKEKIGLEKTIKIEGMMCPHCEARVKKVLEELPQVASAEVSHEKGTAIVTLHQDLSDDVLKKTVEDQGYTVL